MDKKYYEAYEDRYKKIHSETGRAWAGDRPSPTVEALLKKYGANSESKILELGCGEGQNALYLLRQGFKVEASDISEEAINWCREEARKVGLEENNFFVMDALKNDLEKQYDFIYAVAVLHMLVEQDDRDKFLEFIHDHLKADGKAFVIVMGDGKETRQSDTSKAFELAERNFEDKVVKVATTSCRMVTWKEFFDELARAKLRVLNHSIDKTISGFDVSMVAELEKE